MDDSREAAASRDMNIVRVTGIASRNNH